MEEEKERLAIIAAKEKAKQVQIEAGESKAKEDIEKEMGGGHRSEWIVGIHWKFKSVLHLWKLLDDVMNKRCEWRICWKEQCKNWHNILKSKELTKLWRE